MNFGMNVFSNSEISELINKYNQIKVDEKNLSANNSVNIFSQEKTLGSKNENTASDAGMEKTKALLEDFSKIFSVLGFAKNVEDAVAEALNDPSFLNPAIKQNSPKTDLTEQKNVVKEGDFTKTISKEGIVISDKNNEKTEINFAQMAKNFPDEKDKTKLAEILKDLPSEVLVDLSKEINEIVPAKEGEYGLYDNSTNNLSLTLDDHAKYIITHELGHGVDNVKNNVNGLDVNQSSISKAILEDKNFDKTYHEELQKFFDAYKDEKGKNHVWSEYKREVGAGEIAATYYVLKTLGESDTDFAEIMAKNMPETMKKLDEIFETNRNLSDEDRQTSTAKYYDSGQLKSSTWTYNGVAYEDGYNENGTKAYQKQYRSDGTVTIISDYYDEFGNKSTKVETFGTK